MVVYLRSISLELSLSELLARSLASQVQIGHPNIFGPDCQLVNNTVARRRSAAAAPGSLRALAAETQRQAVALS